MLHGLEDPTMGIYIRFSKFWGWKIVQLTIDGRANHAGEASEEGEQTKRRCQVVQPCQGEYIEGWKYIREKAYKIWDWIMKDMPDLIT